MKILMSLLVTVVILASGLMVFSCAIASPLEDYTWIFTGYNTNGQHFDALPQAQVSAVFTSKDKMVTGTAGVNTYSGTYSLNLMTLSFPQSLTVTAKAGADQAVSDQEATFLKILQKTDSFEMDHGNLIIHSGNDRLTFRRVGAGKNPTHWGE
jgi:heat shock protein HslJ